MDQGIAINKLMIVTPAFDGKTYVDYTISFAETLTLLYSLGIETKFKIVTSGSLLCAERNRLLKYFVDSDSTHILCIDSDLGWPPIAVNAKNVS